MLCTDQQNHILSKKDLNKKVVQSALNQEPKLHQQLHLDKIPLHSAGTLKYELLGLYFLKFVSQLHSAFKAQYLCAQQPHIFLTHSVSITQLDLSGHLSVLSITVVLFFGTNCPLSWGQNWTVALHWSSGGSGQNCSLVPGGWWTDPEVPLRWGLHSAQMQWA